MVESPVIVCVHSFIYTDSYTHSHKHTHRHTHTLTQLHILTHTPDFCWGFNMLKFHTLYILTRKMFDELQNQYKTILIKTTQKFSETVRLVYRRPLCTQRLIELRVHKFSPKQWGGLILCNFPLDHWLCGIVGLWRASLWVAHIVARSILVVPGDGCNVCWYSAILLTLTWVKELQEHLTVAFNHLDWYIPKLSCRYKKARLAQYCRGKIW